MTPGSEGPRPGAERLVAWVDGGARGNPGPAGFGVRLETAAGRLVDEVWGWLGETTNNVAEYEGLIAALRHAVAAGCRELVVHTDSELLARQIAGRYKVRQPHLKVLYGRVREAAAPLGRFEVRHVPRERNRHADVLANLAMDRRDSGSTRGGERPPARR